MEDYFVIIYELPSNIESRGPVADILHACLLLFANFWIDCTKM
jgi:hypothetical protein